MGTWNTADSQQITNIVRIRDLISPKIPTTTGAEEQRIYYQTGVGTGLSIRDKFIGGAVGAGLSHNVAQPTNTFRINMKPASKFASSAFHAGRSRHEVWLGTLGRAVR